MKQARVQSCNGNYVGGSPAFITWYLFLQLSRCGIYSINCHDLYPVLRLSRFGIQTNSCHDLLFSPRLSRFGIYPWKCHNWYPVMKMSRFCLQSCNWHDLGSCPVMVVSSHENFTIWYPYRDCHDLEYRHETFTILSPVQQW
jgi:hypothetical protein